LTGSRLPRFLEKLIQHEAVHAIDGWDDLRRRLQPDRRCFAFFHPQLPNEPLIFVEVALLPEVPLAIAPLVDKKAETVTQAQQYKVAVFYSISNCEPGLRGVSMGNFFDQAGCRAIAPGVPRSKNLHYALARSRINRMDCCGANLGDGVPSDRLKPALKIKRDQALQALGLDAQSWAERLSSGWHPDDAPKKEKRHCSASQPFTWGSHPLGAKAIRCQVPFGQWRQIAPD
jgi:malonyl-CoA decarboxylase